MRRADSGDVITRIYATAMQKALGQQVIVENPAGAAGSIGTAKVARSKPDGYTLLMIHVSHATNPFMFKNLSYSPVDDFEPIGMATEGPMVHGGAQGLSGQGCPRISGLCSQQRCQAQHGTRRSGLRIASV